MFYRYCNTMRRVHFIFVLIAVFILMAIKAFSWMEISSELGIEKEIMDKKDREIEKEKEHDRDLYPDLTPSERKENDRLIEQEGRRNV